MQVEELRSQTRYDASNWLAFPPQLTPASMPHTTTTRLSDFSVPNPNSIFPEEPRLCSQTASRDSVTTLENAAQWTYGLRYLHEHASQDEVHLDVHFNEQHDALTNALAASQRPGLLPTRYGFVIDIDYTSDEDGNAHLADVGVSCAAAVPGPSGQWPALIVRTVDNLSMATVRNEISPTQSRYTLEQPVAAGRYADITLELQGIEMVSYQNATASLKAKRNLHLSPRLVTNPDFVLSNTVNMPSPVTPLITVDERLDVTALGTDLGSALTAAFEQLFGTTAYVGQPVTLSLSYRFELLASPAPEAEPLVTCLPIALYPDQRLDASTGASLRDAVDSWIAIQAPCRSGAEIVVSLSLYSQIQDCERLTLLTVQQLVYRLAHLAEGRT